VQAIVTVEISMLLGWVRRYCVCIVRLVLLCVRPVQGPMLFSCVTSEGTNTENMVSKYVGH